MSSLIDFCELNIFAQSVGAEICTLSKLVVPPANSTEVENSRVVFVDLSAMEAVTVLDAC